MNEGLHCKGQAIQIVTGTHSHCTPARRKQWPWHPYFSHRVLYTHRNRVNVVHTGSYSLLMLFSCYPLPLYFLSSEWFIYSLFLSLSPFPLSLLPSLITLILFSYLWDWIIIYYHDPSTLLFLSLLITQSLPCMHVPRVSTFLYLFWIIFYSQHSSVSSSLPFFPDTHFPFPCPFNSIYS